MFQQSDERGETEREDRAREPRDGRAGHAAFPLQQIPVWRIVLQLGTEHRGEGERRKSEAAPGSLWTRRPRRPPPPREMPYLVARSMFFLVTCSLGSECCRLRNSATALAGNSVSHTYPKSLARWTASPGRRRERGEVRPTGGKSGSRLPPRSPTPLFS